MLLRTNRWFKSSEAENKRRFQFLKRNLTPIAKKDKDFESTKEKK